MKNEYLLKCKEKYRDLSEKIGRPLYSYTETFGCQMNARDSEKIRGMLLEIGYEPCEKEDDADVVIYNTCTVRENANLRIYGRLGYLHGLKAQRPHMLIALCEIGRAHV